MHPRLLLCFRYVLAVLCSLLTLAPALASTNYSLTVTTSRPDALYRKGEDVTFTIRLLQDRLPVQEAEVQWVLSKDGVPPVLKNSLRLCNGTGTVTGRLDEPGFLQCRVNFTAPDGATCTAIAGAGVDPLKIKPSLPVPRDFEAFWSAQKQKLAAVPVNPKITPVQSREEGVVCFDLQADCVGAPVSGYFARPVGARAKSLPIILTVQGAGVRNSNLGGTLDWAKQGFLAMDINAHGIPNGKPDKFYEDLANGALKDYRTQGRDSRDTLYFLGMFLRVVRALDFLTAQPEWDGRGAQSFAAAGLDRRVTFFAAGVPAMCDHTAAVAGRVSGWPKIVPTGPDGRPEPKALEASRYYDAVNFAARTKAGAIVTVGFIDPTCPPSSVYAAYNALKGPKEIFNDPPSTHTISPAARDAMRRAILCHAEKMKRKK